MTKLMPKDVEKRHDDGSTTIERHAIVDGRGREIVTDVVDDTWRQRLIDAFNAHGAGRESNATVDVLVQARDAIQEAMDVHIYDADQGEEPEADCGYVATVKALDAAITRERARPDCLAALKTLLPEVDAEIEKRKFSGVEEYWRNLKSLSDAGHAAVEKAEGRANG